MVMRQAARAVVINDGRLLVIHRNKYGKEYYTLPGGGIEPGESPEQAVLRELDEETGVNAILDRMVFIEDPGKPFGPQYVFLCQYQDGEPRLRHDSEEAMSNAQGKNLYRPMWLSLDDLATVSFMSPTLQQALQKAITNGFPTTAESL